MARPKGIPLTTEHNAKLQAASRAAHSGKHYPPKDNVKSCESCHESYEANTGNQKWCRRCAPEGIWCSRIRNYGVSKPAWDKMLSEQNGTCALCDKLPTTVDHCHTTNVTRGLLCHGCNIALNRVDRDGWVENAQSYVKRFRS